MADPNTLLSADLADIEARVLAEAPPLTELEEAKLLLRGCKLELESRAVKIDGLKKQVRRQNELWEEWRRKMLVTVLWTFPLAVLGGGVIGYAFGARFG